MKITINSVQLGFALWIILLLAIFLYSIPHFLEHKTADCYHCILGFLMIVIAAIIILVGFIIISGQLVSGDIYFEKTFNIGLFKDPQEDEDYEEYLKWREERLEKREKLSYEQRKENV